MTPEDFRTPPGDDSTAPEMGRRDARRPDAGIRWMRGDHHVAARISPSDLQGLLSSGLEIQPGTRALLFVGGRYVGTLPPGRHTVESLGKKLKLPTEGEPAAMVVDDGELGFEFEVDGLHSADHHNAVLQAQASLRLAEPEVFFANVMRDRPVFSVADLGRFLAGEIRQGLRELAAEHSAEDLQKGRVRTSMEMELLSRWKPTLDHTGFVLNRFRVLRFILPGLERAEDIRSAGGDHMAEREAHFDAELAGLRLDARILDGTKIAEEEVLQVDLEHQVASTRIRAEGLEKKIPVYERLLSSENLEAMATVKSAEEWRRFKLQVDKDGHLDEHDWQQLKKDLEAEGAQADETRHFATLRVQAMARRDLDELKLTRDMELTLIEQRGGLDLEREKLEAEIANRRAAFDNRMQEIDRELESALGHARSKAELQLWRAERLAALEQLRKDQQAARELQLEVTRAEKAREHLAQEGATYRDMTPEQIMAVAVARDPAQAAEVAKAIQAVKAGEATERERELYERMLAEARVSRALDHDKFVIQAESSASARADRTALDEREKDRAERIATAGLSRGDVVHRYEGVAPKNAAPGDWRWCETHKMKYRGERCPLCAEEGT